MYWYEADVKSLEERPKIELAPETIFYGSSTIRMWATLNEDFKALKPVNLGFGGSTLSACVWFFDRIMAPYHPKRLVVYAGDNDLGDGRHPEEVFIFFQQLVVKTAARFGDIPCYFISLKPSLQRWAIVDQFKYTNNLIANEIIKNDSNWKFIDVFKSMVDATGKPIKEYFVADGLHLSEKGYQLWTGILNEYITPK